MSAELHVRPGEEVPSWQEFTATHDPYSIALDGYVLAPPQFERTLQGPYWNADHHVGVNRLATLSASQQVLRGIRTGLVSAFRRDGEFNPNVYINDCDQDVALAWYMLENAEEVHQERGAQRAMLRTLVETEGVLDATGGSYPYAPDAKIMRQIAWLFDPFTSARMTGELYRNDGSVCRQILAETTGRIALHILGEGSERELDTRYKVIGGGPGWSMFTEVGKEGRIGAFYDNIEAYVIPRQRPDGRWQYTIGRQSEFVPFDVPEILTRMNFAETIHHEEQWGGSDIIGGSPRRTGSGLGPSDVEQIINKHIRRSQRFRSTDG